MIDAINLKDIILGKNRVGGTILLIIMDIACVQGFSKFTMKNDVPEKESLISELKKMQFNVEEYPVSDEETGYTVTVPGTEHLIQEVLEENN